jgi:hypothetical protein
MASIFDILKAGKGVGIGAVQSVDEMTVIPLVGENRGDVARPEALKFTSTTNYGSMVFKNEDSKPAIVPANYMVRGRGAQDHAMAGSGVVTAGQSKTFNTACCIEETQGGYLNAEGNDEDVLPVELRRSLLNFGKRNERHYGKLWDSIKVWLRGLNLNRRTHSAHLREFYDDKDVRNALEQFAAEFEPVEGQIGAIIMFSGTPVGLEIMPTTDHWDAYWQQLLRGCYGSELLRLKMLGQVKPSTLVLPTIPEQAAPDEVKTILEEFMEHLQQEVIPLVQRIAIQGDRSISKDGNLETRLISTGNGGGDIILQGSEPIYISLIL